MLRKLFVAVALSLVITRSVQAVKIADLTRIAGARTNELTGIGLVVGLKGTGDGGNYPPATATLAAMLTKLELPTNVGELGSSQNCALVMVSATVPPSGMLVGDHMDLRVSSIGSAASLKNGHIYNAYLFGPNGAPYIPHDAAGNKLKARPFALGNGELDIQDPTAPTSALVHGGAVAEADITPEYVQKNRFVLIINDPIASWTMANNIAKVINDFSDSGQQTARVVNPKNVVVEIPSTERDQPENFISSIQRLNVPVHDTTEARVLINTKKGTMIVTGDVEISPTVISQKGLTISTITPEPTPTVRNPRITEHNSIPFDTTSQGGARLQELASSLDELKVPIEDRIEIMEELYNSGKLHAKLIVEGQEQ